MEPEESRLSKDILDSRDLESWTGTKASTWRYWDSIGLGPPSWKLGRRRVWRKADALAWLAAQEKATGMGGDEQ
jgi:DNA-binding transcriptional MerR regulator